jgi:hypothetical protein
MIFFFKRKLDVLCDKDSEAGENVSKAFLQMAVQGQ